MRVTIRDVAKKANCSISTVSLALNKKAAKISPETRARVFRAAEELGYRPNQLAVSLLKKRSAIIGLVVPDISNPYFALMTKEVERICHQYQYHLILVNSHDLASKEVEQVKALLDKSVDGLLLALASRAEEGEEAELFGLLECRRMPYCVIDRKRFGLGRHFVGVDQVEGGRLATEALLKAGHRRIACLDGPPHELAQNKRFMGYRLALEAAGIAYEPSLILEGDYSWFRGREAASALMETGASAVFAFNDLSALGLMHGLYRLRVNVPEDMSVMGFDDADYAPLFDVPLTTVRQPIDQMVQVAFEHLLGQMTSEGEAEAEASVAGGSAAQGVFEIILQPELVWRESVGSLGGSANVDGK